MATPLQRLPFPDRSFRIKNIESKQVLGLTAAGGVLAQIETDADNQKWTCTSRGPVDSKKGIYSFANLARQEMRLGYKGDKDKPPPEKTKVEGVDDIVAWTIWWEENGIFTMGVEIQGVKLLLEDELNTQRISLKEESGGEEQRWEFIILTPTSPPTSSNVTKVTNISSGIKYIVRSWNESLVMTIRNKSAEPKATDQIYITQQSQRKNDPKVVEGQIWTVNVKANGRYEVYNVASRLYLAIADGKDAAYQEVTGSAKAFEWNFNSIGGFAWTITSPTKSKLAVGHGASKPTGGELVYLLPNNTSQTQIWFFEELDEREADQIFGKVAPIMPPVTWDAEPKLLSNCTIRNRGTGQVLNAASTSSWNTINDPVPPYSKWNLIKNGSIKEYAMVNTWNGWYGYSSAGSLAAITGDATRRLCFAQADANSFYISFLSDASPRKVMAAMTRGSTAHIVDFKQGELSQTWTIEA